jgi:hypothetical protein
VTIEEALEILERDLSRHMTADRVSERDLDFLEEALGQRLPEQFRTFLVRLGGGILYERHELFGARRLMVHDIELVPDVLSFHRRFVGNGDESGRTMIPFHRAEGVVHLLDLRPGGEARVVSEDGARTYPDLASFLLQVVIPSVVPDEP